MGTQRKCTRCKDENGVPTGFAGGGTCFLCDGNGYYTRETVTAEAKTAGQQRAEAIAILKAATADMPRRTMITLMDARAHLEDTDPAAHANLVHSVLAGRTAKVVAGLAAYADKNGFN